MNNYVLNKINNFWRLHYYDYYLKNFSSNELNKTNKTNNYIKFDYFIILKIYIIHLFFYYFEKNNIFIYSFFLYFQNIIGESCISNIKYYNIECTNNVFFLNHSIIFFFDFLLFNEIYFKENVILTNKIVLFIYLFLFQVGIIINKLFKKRVEHIKNNSVLNNEFNFLFLLPGFENIDFVIEKTNFFNYSNFYIYLNILFIFLF